MTAPAMTQPYTVPVGGQAVRLTDGSGNTPAGLTLVNRGDSGGTVWISAGPALSAASIPLGPGATLQWTDPANFPYAALASSATAPETVVVTSQASGYANPSVVAAALIAQGIPSTMLDTDLGTYRIASGASLPKPLQVGMCSTLVVGVEWPQPAPQGPTVLRLRFDDPTSPSLPPIDYFCTNNNAVEETANTWQVPVVAPRLTVTNLASSTNADAYVSVVGNNRPAVGGFRQLGQRIGTKTLYADVPTANANVTMRAFAGDPTFVSNAGTNPGTGPMTRFNGPVTLTLTVGSVAGAGLLLPAWVDETGVVTSPRLLYVSATGLNDLSMQWNHPSVPVYWRYMPLASNAGNYCRLTVTGAG